MFLEFYFLCVFVSLFFEHQEDRRSSFFFGSYSSEHSHFGINFSNIPRAFQVVYCVSDAMLRVALSVVVNARKEFFIEFCLKYHFLAERLASPTAKGRPTKERHLLLSE